MPVAVIEGFCVGCSLCVLECPEEAISARSKASIDIDRCTECQSCVIACPCDAIEEVQS